MLRKLQGAKRPKTQLDGRRAYAGPIELRGATTVAFGHLTPVTPPCRTHDMAARHLVIPCNDTRTVLYRAGLWRDATTLLVGIGSCKISVGTSAEGIQNTSFSKQGHRYGAVYQLSHVGPPGTLTLDAM